MRLPVLLLLAVSFTTGSAAMAAVRPHHHTSAHPIVSRSASTRSTRVAHVVEHASYSGISTERATEIQSALIQKGYLTGEPSGSWDAASVAAMQKLQSENGWQTKYVPDSRALIKLGLGAGSTSSPVAGAAPANTSATAVPQDSQLF